MSLGLNLLLQARFVLRIRTRRARVAIVRRGPRPSWAGSADALGRENTRGRGALDGVLLASPVAVGGASIVVATSVVSDPLRQTVAYEPQFVYPKVVRILTALPAGAVGRENARGPGAFRRRPFCSRQRSRSLAFDRMTIVATYAACPRPAARPKAPGPRRRPPERPRARRARRWRPALGAGPVEERPVLPSFCHLV
jgi:hypothetical protein